MVRFDFGEMPLATINARLFPKTNTPMCLSRRVVAAALRGELVTHQAKVAAMVKRPSSVAVEQARAAGEMSRQIAADSIAAFNAFWGITSPTEPKRSETTTPSSLEFRPSETLHCGLAAILGCTACDGGLRPSPETCPLDEKAVADAYAAASLGDQPKVEDTSSE